MKRIVIALNVLILILSSCAREVVEPAQQITGRYALDDGTGLTDQYLEFDCGIIYKWQSASLYPLAENYIWDYKMIGKFLLYRKAEYSIQDEKLFCDLVDGRIEREGDCLTLDGRRYMRLDGFKEEPYSVIAPEKLQYEIPLQEEEYSLPVTVENPIPAGELTASSSDNWITGLTVKDGIVLYRVSTTNTTREGRITLKYTQATDVQVSIKQSPSTFIRLEETSKTINYAAATVEIPYTIENPVDGSELAVSSTADWCQDIVIQSDKIIINLPDNNSGSSRTANLTISYAGAEDVNFTLTQEYNAVSIVLTPSSAQFDYAGGTGSFIFEVQNPREGASITAISQASWITDVAINGSAVSYKVAENNSGGSRIGQIKLTYGTSSSTMASTGFIVSSHYSAPAIVITPSTAQFDYVGGTGSFTFDIQNPREGASVTAISQANWITDVTVTGNTVSYKVSENNSGGQRTGNIRLTYGSYATVNFNVVQKYTAASITLTPFTVQLDYAGGSGSFSYEIQNPREGATVTATSQVDWITDVVITGDNVSYKVEENISYFQRAGKIRLSYGNYASVDFTVAQSGVQVSSLTLNKSNLDLFISTNEKLVATVSPSDALLVWSSSASSIASVDQTGFVTAVGNGETTITVSSSDGQKSTSCVVTVTTPVTGVSLNKSILILEPGDVESLIATITPSTASNKAVIWTSNNESVASITQDGQVQGKTEGEAIITIKTVDGEKTATCSVKVREIPDGAVDLGLSVFWASCNLGALSYDYGSYYSTPQIAKNNLTDGWRLPSKADFEELLGNCSREWITMIYWPGIKFTSKKPGYTDKWIFIPAAGLQNTSFSYAGELGYYLTSSPSSYGNYWILEFGGGTNTGLYSYALQEGGARMSVRPVHE